MPTSTWKSISLIFDLIMNLSPRPQSVLDIGLGNGKYGFLSREYLTFWGNRYSDGQSRPTIDGIEVFPEYIQKIHEEIYDHVYVGNALDILPALPENSYDLILLIDVLEHFSIEEGEIIVAECKRVAKTTLISTPIEMEQQGAAFGNRFETHLSNWTNQMLKQSGAKFVLNSSDQNWVALFTENGSDEVFKIINFHSNFRILVRLLIPYQVRRSIFSITGDLFQ
jgi:ubiquinone/menaquinone biosynthesis C-methylase UbiE